MFIYADQLATPGTLTTNGSINTATETGFLKPGTNASVYLSKISIGGAAAAATALSHITVRGLLWATASTGGTGFSLIARTKGAPATGITGASRSTAGTTRTNVGPIVSCGVASGNVWQTENIDAMPSVPAGNAGSLAFEDLGGAASMPFSFELEHREF
jgi:hypothetical protein